MTDRPEPETLSALALKFLSVDRDKYKMLRDIHEVMKISQPFNECYSGERPDRYTSGIDYVTKGFGYVDSDFRNKHPFAKDTREVFNAFSHKT